MASKKFSRLSIMLEAKDKMSSVFTKASNASKKLSNNVDKLSNSAKKVKKDIDYSNTSIIKSKRSMDELSNTAKKSIVSQTKLGKSIRETALAFNLWKNNSKGVEKVNSVFEKMTSPLKKIGNLIKLNVQNMKQFNGETNKMGGRRATFNQLADANAKLNRQLEKMNRELQRANSRLGSMRTNLGSINMMGAAFTAMYTGQAALQGGQSVVTDTIGYSMEQQYARESVGILAGKENGEKFYNSIVDYASSTTFSPEDWSRNLRGAIGKSKTTEDLETFMLAMEQLATLDPLQGLDGAALAIRELNSGDTLSLVERFELPRSKVNELKSIKDPIEQTRALMELVGKETGFTVDNITKMKELPLMQWEKAKNVWQTMKGYIGEAAATKLGPVIKQFNDMWDNGEFDGFIKVAGEGLASITEKVINFVTGFAANYESTMARLKEKNGPLIELAENVKKSWNEAKPTLLDIGSNILDIINKMAGVVNDNWPLINKVFQSILGLVERATGFINKNFEGIIAVVAGLATAFAGLKIAGAIKSVISFVNKVKEFGKAGKLLKLFPKIGTAIKLLSGPIGWIVIGISALVAAGIYLYRNWDKVKEKAGELWEKLKNNPIAWLVAGPLMTLITAAVKVYQNWDQVKASIQKVWDAFKNSPLYDFTIGPVASLIESLKWLWDNWDQVKASMQNVWNKVLESPLGEFLTSTIDPLNSAIQGMSGFFDSALNAFHRFADGVSSFKMPGWVKTIGTVVNPLGAAAGALKNAVNKATGRSHHGGISNVPKDRYQAILHKGERVLTRQENKEYSNGNNQGILISGNNFTIREEADIDKVVDGLYRKIQERRNMRGGGN